MTDDPVEWCGLNWILTHVLSCIAHYFDTDQDHGRGSSNLSFAGLKDFDACRLRSRTYRVGEKWHNPQAMMRGPCSGPPIIAPRSPVYLQGKKKGLSKLRSTELHPKHAHAPPASCSHMPLAREQRVFSISPLLARNWRDLSQAGCLSLGGKCRVSMGVGVLLLQLAMIHSLVLDTLNSPSETKEYLSFLGNFWRQAFQSLMLFGCGCRWCQILLGRSQGTLSFTPGHMGMGLCNSLWLGLSKLSASLLFHQQPSK